MQAAELAGLFEHLTEAVLVEGIRTEGQGQRVQNDPDRIQLEPRGWRLPT
jgi:hypothetical protein